MLGLLLTNDLLVLESAFATGDFVLINHGDPSEPEKLAAKKAVKGEWPHGETWPAKILKVVAGNESHVYLLVNYFYLPEDIRADHVSKPTLAGRQKHHSAHEVIMSNELDIVDASTSSPLQLRLGQFLIAARNRCCKDRYQALERI